MLRISAKIVMYIISDYYSVLSVIVEHNFCQKVIIIINDNTY